MLVRWNERPSPMRQASCGCTPVMSRPSSSTWPLSGCRWPVIRLNRVDLPAPLGPITAAICRASTRSDTSETATKPAKDLRSTAISSIAPAPEPPDGAVDGAEDAARKQEQEHDQNRAQDEGPIFGVGGDLLVQQGQHQRADRRPPEMLHPAEDGHDHHIGGFRPEHEIGEDAAVEDAEERARKPGEAAGNREGGKLVGA